ncbi:MAPEG family protein [Sphingomonas jatrophae]|uniref:Uncharacterized conserved protein, MAPEG superfamily n=1 Tax=Sphingomonas jatrophae TaxID=1166337 RepID=A0A1I6JR91_9SPHN|nr:MAPEG family protein [Sphingomonas jatrophae]SFR81494.1 Uncharacterized conserved protein, MAPEG superfamily [Sphingomonas jatrophae]
MRIELVLLGWALVLALVHIFVAGHFKTRQYGAKWNTGARDEVLPAPQPLVGRLMRAQANYYETLPIFIGAVLAATVANRLDGTTALGAHIWFWGRVIYLPLYAAGVPVVRSIVFIISLVGLVMILYRLLAS